MAAARPSSSTSARRPPVSARGIRWDRIGRVALLCVLAGVVYLYIGPTSNWISTWRESKARHAALAELKAENARLKARRAELRKPRTMEAEARRLGMVRPGEKAYVIEGLPGG
jgi:cell division protein FtsB